MIGAQPLVQLYTITGQRERDRGQWAFYYTSPQSFIIAFSHLLASLGTSVNSDWWDH